MNLTANEDNLSKIPNNESIVVALVKLTKDPGASDDAKKHATGTLSNLTKNRAIVSEIVKTSDNYLTKALVDLINDDSTNAETKEYASMVFVNLTNNIDNSSPFTNNGSIVALRDLIVGNASPLAKAHATGALLNLYLRYPESSREFIELGGMEVLRKLIDGDASSRAKDNAFRALKILREQHTAIMGEKYGKNLAERIVQYMDRGDTESVAAKKANEEAHKAAVATGVGVHTASLGGTNLFGRSNKTLTSAFEAGGGRSKSRKAKKRKSRKNKKSKKNKKSRTRTRKK